MEAKGWSLLFLVDPPFERHHAAPVHPDGVLHVEEDVVCNVIQSVSVHPLISGTITHSKLIRRCKPLHVIISGIEDADCERSGSTDIILWAHSDALIWIGADCLDIGQEPDTLLLLRFRSEYIGGIVRIKELAECPQDLVIPALDRQVDRSQLLSIWKFCIGTGFMEGLCHSNVTQTDGDVEWRIPIDIVTGNMQQFL